MFAFTIKANHTNYLLEVTMTDAIDQLLINALMEDSRRSLKALAQISGLSAPSGSLANTSRPAPAMRRSPRAAIRAGSSTVSPRPTLTKTALAFIAPKTVPSIRRRFSGLAGSTLTMDVALRRAVADVGLPMEIASAAASGNPARVLGLGDQTGRIVAGLDADLVVLDETQVGGDLIRQSFLVILTGLVFALALAFGLGGRNWAAERIETWWPSERKPEPGPEGLRPGAEPPPSAEPLRPEPRRYTDSAPR